MKSTILKELNQAKEVLNRFLSDELSIQKMEDAAQILIKSIKRGGKIISCGNGGSMADAIHFAEELTGKFRDNRSPIPAIAISDPGYISCVANDYGYEHVFSRFITAFGKGDDVLFAISTSGNSENVWHAAQQARQQGIKIIALTGNNGGKLSTLADVEIRVPHTGYADRIQEMHIKVIHILILLIEKEV